MFFSSSIPEMNFANNVKSEYVHDRHLSEKVNFQGSALENTN